MKQFLTVVCLVALAGCAGPNVTAKQRDDSMSHAGKMYSTTMLYYMNLPH